MVAPCLRGHGYSSYENQITCLKDFADDLYLFVKEHLKLKNFYLLGHSRGSIVALFFGMNYNSMLKGLVLISPFDLHGELPLPWHTNIEEWLASSEY